MGRLSLISRICHSYVHRSATFSDQFYPLSLNIFHFTPKKSLTKKDQKSNWWDFAKINTRNISKKWLFVRCLSLILLETSKVIEKFKRPLFVTDFPKIPFHHWSQPNSSRVADLCFYQKFFFVEVHKFCNNARGEGGYFMK